MRKTAKLFKKGRNQAICLPAEFRFEGDAVYIRRDPKTGDVILSQKHGSWQEFFELLDKLEIPENFMEQRDDPPPPDRDLFN